MKKLVLALALLEIISHSGQHICMLPVVGVLAVVVLFREGGKEVNELCGSRLVYALESSFML